MQRSTFRNILATTVVALSIAPAIFAQGLVNFYNDANTPVYAQELVTGGTVSLMSGPRDSFYFGLLIGDFSLGNFVFTGIYATNTGVSGFFSGGTVAVPGWIPGSSTNFTVVGWSRAYVGHDYNPFLIDLGDHASVNGFGVAGNGSTIPALNLFNGGPGTIMESMVLRNSLVPEPSAAALIAVETTVLLLCRREKTGNHVA